MESSNFAIGEAITSRGDSCSSCSSCAGKGGSRPVGASGPASSYGPGPRTGPGTIEMVASYLLFAVGLLLRPWLQEHFYGIGEYLFFLIPWLISGRSVLLSALRNSLKGAFFDENFLMTLASLGAIALGELPEAAAVMLFFTTGDWFQERAVNSARRSIDALLTLRPDTVHVMEGDVLTDASPEDVEPGVTILIRPGERIPLDGVILSGSSWLDLSALTGESRPVSVGKDDEVLSGGVNGSGVLTMAVQKRYQDSALARIIRLVEEAAERKAPVERFITRFAKYYTPAVTLAALLIAVLPPLLLPGASFGEWIHRALVLLVISCPCALVISIPLGYFGGIGGASRAGILIKGANYLEALARLDSVIFDKTGTLTEGKFRVESIIPYSAVPYGAALKGELLQLAAAAEAHSSHPVATAIRRAAEAVEGSIEAPDEADYQELSGEGIAATVGGKRVYTGNEKLLSRFGIEIPEVNGALQGMGGTTVHVAGDGSYLGRITISDRIKAGAVGIGEALKAVGVRKSMMLTGDTEASAKRIAGEAKVDAYYASLLPEEKLGKLEELMTLLPRKSKCAFIGDGINDAPVLSRADIGIAMGGIGSDAAIEASDVVLIDDRPEKVITAIRGAKATRTIVVQNIIFALGFKTVVMAFGAFGLAGMWMAVIADVGVALLAVLNSTRALKAFSA